MIEILIKGILQASLFCSIGIVLIIILRKYLFMYYSQSFKYYIWLVILVKLIIPFNIPIYIPEKMYNNYSPHLLNIVNHEFIKSNIVEMQNNVNIYKILFCLWIIGMIIFAIYHICTYLSFTSKIKLFSCDILDEDIIAVYLKLLCDLDIRGEISLKYCTGIDSPLGTGIFKHCILLPQNSYNIKEIEWILKHELIHFKKRDLFYKIIALIASVIHWFNPLIYIMIRIIDSDCELTCDEVLLKDSDIESRKLYATIFLNSLRHNKRSVIKDNMVTGFNINQNILKGRIENMLSFKKKRKGLLFGILAVAITVSTFLSVKTLAANNNITALKSPTNSTTINTQTTNTAKTLQSEEKTLPNGLKIVYRGTLSNMPTALKTPDIEKAFHDGNWKIVISSGYKSYTYATAPAEVKAQYEANCKAINKTPAPSDPIDVP